MKLNENVIKNNPLPWHVVPPYIGCNGRRVTYSVFNADGGCVYECFGEDDGLEEALMIVELVNKAGPSVCAFCGNQATCFGSYEDRLNPVYACNTCCGHGNEDGRCDLLIA